MVRLVEREATPLPPGRPPDARIEALRAVRERIRWEPSLGSIAAVRSATLDAVDLLTVIAAYQEERAYRLALEQGGSYER